MPRIILRSWWCRNNHKNEGHDTLCVECSQPRREKHAQVHSSERAVVYENPVTGERKIPARSDQPMPPQYAQQGFERREIMDMTSYEKETGLVHEASNYHEGNAEVAVGSPSDPVTVPVDKVSKQAIIEDMREAIASGPWTGGLPDSV